MALSKILPASQDQYVGARNLIINGAMTVAQRGTSTASITGADIFVVDRWRLDEGADSTLTMSQETITSGDAFNAGFNNSVKVLTTTADTSIGSSQSVQLMQHIEAQNLSGLKFGTSNAESLTLSFYYKSNVTGVHTVCIDKPDNTKTMCPIEFTVSSADTWTKYTLTAVANSAVQGSSGAIANDNGTGLRVIWGLAYGSDYTGGTSGTWEQNGTGNFSTSNQQNIVGTANNYIEFTGVQLEVGDTATLFEHEDYGTTLRKCQRYLRLGGAGVYGIYNSATNIEISEPFSPNMRATPTLSMAKTSVTISNKTNSNTATATSVSATNISASPSGAFFAQIGNCNVTSASSGHIAQFRTDEFLQLDAEL